MSAIIYLDGRGVKTLRYPHLLALVHSIVTEAPRSLRRSAGGASVVRGPMESGQSLPQIMQELCHLVRGGKPDPRVSIRASTRRKMSWRILSATDASSTRAGLSDAAVHDTPAICRQSLRSFCLSSPDTPGEHGRLR